MERVKKYLYASVGATLFFVLALLWYAKGPVYLGPIFIGVVAGAVVAVQIAVFALLISRLVRDGFRASILAVMLINLFLALGVGFFFELWWEMVVTGKP